MGSNFDSPTAVKILDAAQGGQVRQILLDPVRKCIETKMWRKGNLHDGHKHVLIIQ